MIKKLLQQPELYLRLLGEFSLQREGRDIVGLSYKKGRAILAYLAGEPAAHARQKLSWMFWPDLSPKDARSNLRQVLLNLRQRLNDAHSTGPALLIDHQSVRFNPDGPCALDLAEFSPDFPTCTDPSDPAHCAGCLSHMMRVAALYRGEFLTGFTLPDCPEFEDWLMVQRETLRRRALMHFEHLCNCLERQGRFAEALPFALRITELDPWNERGHRRAMRLFAQDGQSGNAISQYDYCSRTLRKELGIEPGAEIRLLAEHIRAGIFPRAEPETAISVPKTVSGNRQPEHRQVTVLHCELTPMSSEDPDEAMVRRQIFRNRCDQILKCFAGHWMPSHDGGILAYFGYPQADEHAARQAIRAALALCAEPFEGLQIRAGIHTGTIVTGSDPNIPDAVGSTSGMAMALSFRAEAGEVTISEPTRKLAEGHFSLTSLGAQKVRGSAQPLELFRITGRSGTGERLDAADTLAPFCGRQPELNLLLNHWRDATAGNGKAVLLQGEPGIGKSRLIRTMKEALGTEDYILRTLRCLPELSRSPFHPLIDLFNEIIGITSPDGPETRFAKLVNYAEGRYAEDDLEVIPLLAEMLAIPLPVGYNVPAASPAQQREKICLLVLDRLGKPAARQPLLIVLEDLHWADPSTLELLALLLKEIPNRAILLLMSARAEFVPPWPKSHYIGRQMVPLENDDVRRLTQLLAPELADETVAQIVARADGIPLFVEEITSLAHSANADAATVIPTTLLDLLTARLDSLGEAKPTAQLAANIGREFRLELLEKISPLDEPALHQKLDALLKTGIVQKLTPHNFQFKHILLRDAAYRSQPKAVRRETHGRIARVLQKDFSATVAARPEILARHLALAEQYTEAVDNWIKAGKQASLHSACQEARMHFKEGLGLIAQLKDSPEKLRLEFELQAGLGLAACKVQGYGAPDASDAFKRAMALGEHGGDDADMFRAVWGLWAGASSRAGYQHALDLAQQLLRMALHGNDPVQQQQGHFAVGNTRFWRGEFVAAREHLEQAIALYRPRHHQQHISRFGENVRVTSGAYLSWVLWFLGYPDRAQTIGKQAVQLARRLGHPFSRGYAMTFFTLLQRHLGLPEKTLDSARETHLLAVEQDFLLWQTAAETMQGWAEVMLGEPTGMPRMLHSVETMRTVMGGVTLSFLVPLIEARLQQKNYPEALASLEEAFTITETLGDRHLEAELHRLKGECLLGTDPADATEAETCFQQALTISRRQQAKSLELRAALSLARLWSQQHRSEEANSLLKNVYGWFEEGLDMPELRAAKDLINRGI